MPLGGGKEGEDRRRAKIGIESSKKWRGEEEAGGPSRRNTEKTVTPTALRTWLVASPLLWL
jgi:hypothetical protein